jgi:hypothetical protein
MQLARSRSLRDPQVTCSVTATSGEVGTAFNSPAVTVTGGTSPYTFSIVGTLPAGLTLNTATGAVTGTPDGGGYVLNPGEGCERSGGQCNLPDHDHCGTAGDMLGDGDLG